MTVISMALVTMACFQGVVASRTNFSVFTQEIDLIIADVADGSTGLVNVTTVTTVTVATGGIGGIGVNDLTDLTDLIAATDVIADAAGNRMLAIVGQET